MKPNRRNSRTVHFVAGYARALFAQAVRFADQSFTQAVVCAPGADLDAEASRSGEDLRDIDNATTTL